MAATMGEIGKQSSTYGSNRAEKSSIGVQLSPLPLDEGPLASTSKGLFIS